MEAVFNQPRLPKMLNHAKNIFQALEEHEFVHYFVSLVDIMFVL